MLRKKERGSTNLLIKEMIPMKKVIAIAVFCASVAGILHAATPPTCTGPSAGLVVGTQLQADAASASQGAGDLYVADELKVSGTSALTGALTVTGAITSGGAVRGSYIVASTTFNVTTATPTYVGQIVLGSDYLVYVGTQTATCKWAKIGAQ